MYPGPCFCRGQRSHDAGRAGTNDEYFLHRHSCLFIFIEFSHFFAGQLAIGPALDAAQGQERILDAAQVVDLVTENSNMRRTWRLRPSWMVISTLVRLVFGS